MFCLISSTVSPSLPPNDGYGLLNVNESNNVFAKVGLVPYVKFLKDISVTVNPFCVIVFTGWFDSIPPPTKYVTVNVVLEGAIPYSLAIYTFDLLKLELNMLGIMPNWVLSGSGSNTLSAEIEVPAPNCNCNVYYHQNCYDLMFQKLMKSYERAIASFVFK